MKEYLSTLIGTFTEKPLTIYVSLLALVIIIVLVILLRKQKFTTNMLSTGAISVAISFVLSCIILFKMVNGGSITPVSMLPIIIYAWTFGPVAGVAAGLLYGLLQIVQGAYFLHPLQFIFDYIFPFALLGFAGFFKKNFYIGIVVACSLRFLMHLIAGAVFWGEFAPAGQNPWIYSLIYNGSYMLPEMILCLVISFIPAVRKLIEHISKRKLVSPLREV